MTNFPTDRRFLREIREPDIRPEIDPHIDYHIGTLTNDFVARRRRLFGFERDASEPIEVSLADPKHLDWDGPRNGADWGPCVRDGKRVIYRLFVGPSDWACPLCPETARQEPVLPLPKGKQLDAALDELAAALIRYQGELPGRKDLYKRHIQPRPEFRNATYADVQRLRRDFGSPESKKGGARYHRSRLSDKSQAT